MKIYRIGYWWRSLREWLGNVLHFFFAPESIFMVFPKQSDPRRASRERRKKQS